jgi:hypothetical protein
MCKTNLVKSREKNTIRVGSDNTNVTECSLLVPTIECCDVGLNSFSRRLCSFSLVSGDGLGDCEYHVSFEYLVTVALFENGEAFGTNFRISDLLIKSKKLTN